MTEADIAANGRVDRSVRPPHAGSHVFKTPKMLMKPPAAWFEVYGMRRAIKVLDLQAARLRAEGNNRTAHGLREVSKALKAAINKGAPVPECITLGWPNAKVSCAGTASAGLPG